MIELGENDTQASGGDSSMMPMVDVIFTLIAFMMLIINAPQLTLDLELPSSAASASSQAPEQPLTLTILDSAQGWRINGGPTLNAKQTEAALSSIIAAKGKAPVTLLEVDKNAPAQRVVDTLELLGALAIEDARFLLEPASQ